MRHGDDRPLGERMQLFGRRHAVLPALAAVAALTLVSLPSASADQCAVTVTLVTGQTLSFGVEVPPGTPLSSVPLPVKVPIASVSGSCTHPAPTPTSPT